MNEPLNGEAIRLIAEIGFMGTRTDQCTAARAIFQSILVLRPETNLPYIGLAVAEMAAERMESAVQILREQGLARLPGDPEIMAFLGLALECAGRNAEARKVAAAVIEQEKDGSSPHVRMASKLLSMRRNDNALAGLMPRWTEQPSDADVEPSAS